jgi:glycosyltransferase involved in cell wall biosynthesis
MSAQSEKVIVMLGIHPQSKRRGGISSVTDVYRQCGLFARWPIEYIGTVASGSALTKARVAVVAMLRFAAIVVSGRLVLLHAHTSARGSLWRKIAFILVALAARRPVIMHLHSGEFETYYRERCGPWRKRLVRFVFRRVDRIVVLSRHMQNVVRRIEPAAKATRIFNPIVLPSQAAAARKPSPVLLFLGVLAAKKGVFDLLEALAVVRRHFPSVRLRLGGYGDVASVEARALELGVYDCVELLGWVGGERKERELAEATVYVLPSYAEGLPMGVLEAMAVGTPVVATAVGGIPDAIENGVEGCLVPPGDARALADRIMRLLGSPELRMNVAAAAQKKVREQFSAEVVLSQVEALYASLGAAPRRPTAPNGPAHEPRERHSGAAA